MGFARQTECVFQLPATMCSDGAGTASTKEKNLDIAVTNFQEIKGASDLRKFRTQLLQIWFNLLLHLTLFNLEVAE